LAELAHSQS
jgi:hypothetical protein